jgi:hypothetical protein
MKRLLLALVLLGSLACGGLETSPGPVVCACCIEVLCPGCKEGTPVPVVTSCALIPEGTALACGPDASSVMVGAICP